MDSSWTVRSTREGGRGQRCSGEDGQEKEGKSISGCNVALRLGHALNGNRRSTPRKLVDRKGEGRNRALLLATRLKLNALWTLNHR